jgi:hypothetical protein
MRSQVRGTLASLVVLAALALLAPAAQALSVSVWEAGTCEAKGCTYASIKSNPKEAFTQSAGHPEWGITSFEVNAPGGKPEGQVKRIRVDVPEGLAANPQALPSCTRAEFNSNPALCELKGAKVKPKPSRRSKTRSCTRPSRRPTPERSTTSRPKKDCRCCSGSRSNRPAACCCLRSI